MMIAEQHGRFTASVMALVGAALATVLLFSPFVAEYAAQGAGPVHLRDAWHLTTESPLDGSQRVATAWAVLVIVTTLATLLGVWAGSRLDQQLPLVVAAVSSAVATVVGFVVTGDGTFGNGHLWASVWGLSAWRCAHALVLVAVLTHPDVLRLAGGDTSTRSGVRPPPGR